MASAGEFRLLTIPNELWALLGSIGGIYGIGRSIEKFGAVKRKAEVIKVFQQEYVKSELPKDLDEPENYTPSQVITPIRSTKYKCHKCDESFEAISGGNSAPCPKCQEWVDPS